MEDWSVRSLLSILTYTQPLTFEPNSETNLDDVPQISNVFVNVSKGEVAKSGDLQKAFGKTNVEAIVAEVHPKPYNPSWSGSSNA